MRKSSVTRDFELYQAFAAVVQLMIAYHFGKIDLALKKAKNVRKGGASFKLSVFYLLGLLYDGLSCVEEALHKSHWQRRRHIRRVQKIVDSLEVYAKLCPENVLHKIYLLRAELAALNQNLRLPMEWYWKAICHARDQNMMQLHALSCERASLALNRLGVDPKDLALSAKLRNDAFAIYQDWGATIWR